MLKIVADKITPKSVTKKEHNVIDTAVGARVRARRVNMSISQEKLGEALGVTFQQVQKYEKGTNRISASKLEAIARFLDVPVSYFFEPANSDPNPRSSYGPGFDDSHSNQASISGGSSNHLPDPDTEALIAAFGRVKDPKVKKRILDLVAALTANGDADN